jgi:CheY-like chemotaxis protein
MRDGVLIIDDDRDLRDTLIELLTEAGYRAAGTANGLDGLEAARARLPVLILLDVRMPRVNGWRFLSRRLEYPEIVATPIVVMTGQRPGIDFTPTSLAGPVGYLFKPFSVDDILTQVNRWASPQARRRRWAGTDPGPDAAAVP